MSKTKKPPDVDFVQLAVEMNTARKQLEALPDSQEWTQEQIEDLEDVRHYALNLAREVEATVQTFEGLTGEKP